MLVSVSCKIHTWTNSRIRVCSDDIGEQLNKAAQTFWSGQASRPKLFYRNIANSMV